MAEKNFAITPSVSISRSKFLRTNTHKTSFNLGELVPIYVDEVLPGDTRSIDVASLVRMSTPIAPIMDDIEMEIFAFFVPNRIVWKDWKQFMGESPAPGYQPFSGTFPYVELGTSAKSANCLGGYLGLPTEASNINHKVSAIPLRAYIKIYDRWFRDQNVENSWFADDTDGADASSDNTGAKYDYSKSCIVAYKKSDYFTRALPYAQKGAPVTIPLGTTAAVITTANPNTSYLNIDEPLRWGYKVGTAAAPANGVGSIGKNATGYTHDTGDTYVGNIGDALFPYNLVADLSKATAATINQLREAFQLQKLLEKDALYGTRYWELLYGHFGVRSPDATLQDPEYLGGIKFMINIDQVLSTAGYSNTTSTTVGAPGANSVTGNKGALFTKSFVEHGTLMIIACARQSHHTYGQGIMPMWQRFDRYDYYWPEFANLGAQELKKKYLFALDSHAEEPFGYQEAWADYRYKPSIVSGIMNPALTGSLNYWTLADVFSSAPTLGMSFLKETRDNISRALVTSTTGPDFIADFYFRDTAVRPMPLYSIPGLIDHH